MVSVRALVKVLLVQVVDVVVVNGEVIVTVRSVSQVPLMVRASPAVKEEAFGERVVREREGETASWTWKMEMRLELD